MMELNGAMTDLMTNCEMSFEFNSETVNLMQCDGKLFCKNIELFIVQ